MALESLESRYQTMAINTGIQFKTVAANRLPALQGTWDALISIAGVCWIMPLNSPAEAAGSAAISG